MPLIELNFYLQTKFQNKQNLKYFFFLLLLQANVSREKYNDEWSSYIHRHDTRNTPIESQFWGKIFLTHRNLNSRKILRV